MRMFCKWLCLFIGILLWSGLRDAAAQGRILRFVYCSDLHYGLEREFRGGRATSSEVNRAMLEAFPMLEEALLPKDGGVLAGEAFGEADFVVCTGDIANRMQDGVQTAAKSWAEFERDWLGALDVPLYLVPGNHDISNAIGYPKGLEPGLDATAAAEIYNRAMEPDTLRTAATFDYSRDKVHYVVDCGGLRLAFVGMWLDAGMRAWFDREVAADSLTPVFVFTHEPIFTGVSVRIEKTPADAGVLDEVDGLLWPMQDGCGQTEIGRRVVSYSSSLSVRSLFVVIFITVTYLSLHDSGTESSTPFFPALKSMALSPTVISFIFNPVIGSNAGNEFQSLTSR